MTNVHLAATCVVIIFIANVCYAVSGFGSAILFQIGWHIAEIAGVDGAGGIKEAVAYLSLVSFTVASFQSLWLRAHVNWPLTLLMSCGSLLGMTGGLYATTHLKDDVWLKRAAGVGFFALAVYELTCKHARCGRGKSPLVGAVASSGTDDEVELRALARDAGDEKEGREAEDVEEALAAEAPATSPAAAAAPSRFRPCAGGPEKSSRVGSLLFTAVSSGLLTGLFGTGGPPFMLWVSHQFARGSITVDEWRATRAASSMLTAPLRFAYLLVAGAGGALVTHGARGEVTVGIGGVLLALAMGASGVCAVLIGNACCSRFLDRAAMRRLILYLLLLGSALLVTAGVDLSRLARSVIR